MECLLQSLVKTDYRSFRSFMATGGDSDTIFFDWRKIVANILQVENIQGETVAASPLKTSEKRDDFASVAADPIPKTLNLSAAAAVFPCRFLVNYFSLALFSGSVSFSKTLYSLPVRCLHFVSGFVYRLPPSILSISGSRSIYLFIGSWKL
ncbi:hypothetical protein LWI28_010284 [Acer negundo]|uniref:Uncharacterized protein n=1 Tax=Acer negundo TaxID=4023 RepID=A0AAD5IC96_ACENE|nr:hypothetical protein LWI28_010284 [Acer negundo]